MILSRKAVCLQTPAVSHGLGLYSFVWIESAYRCRTVFCERNERNSSVRIVLEFLHSCGAMETGSVRKFSVVIEHVAVSLVCHLTAMDCE